MDDLEREAKQAALDDVKHYVGRALSHRLDSRRPKPAPAPEAPKPSEPDVDVDALTRMLSEG